MKLNIEVIRKQYMSGGYVGLFRGTVIPDVGEVVTDDMLETLPRVDLSRREHGGCIFRVDIMEDHDSHAPGFGELGGDTGLNQYIERVLSRITSSMKESGMEFVTTEQNFSEVPATFQPVEALAEQPPSDLAPAPLDDDEKPEKPDHIE